MKTLIKKGDSVVVMVGDDRGKTGKVLSVIPKEGKLVVEGINTVKRHMRTRRAGGKGQVIEKPMPFALSNVLLKDSDSGKGSRVGRKEIGGKLVRILRKSGKEV